jgi:hypothetical protein
MASPRSAVVYATRLSARLPRAAAAVPARRLSENKSAARRTAESPIAAALAQRDEVPFSALSPAQKGEKKKTRALLPSTRSAWLARARVARAQTTHGVQLAHAHAVVEGTKTGGSVAIIAGGLALAATFLWAT